MGLAAYLGLEGAECSRLAQQLVPRSFLNLREAYGKAHTSFLAPPTTNCINSACPRKGDAHSLYIHHTEVEVTVFTLTGPLPTTKVSIRRKACLTVYNYGKFGRKGSQKGNDITMNVDCLYRTLRRGVLHPGSTYVVHCPVVSKIVAVFVIFWRTSSLSLDPKIT